ncbi:uncharacterized protein B0T15DRAFT_79781 [Chaetomium strumarium]|uniref:RTA1 domain-containing protein n=1 Tax=Chaetomium strumarium TaxID=1170767 RepID=A0AAJ0H4C6_9PEZI|nr:hypothetical protein B0T15DRAFT_79781 [Chaetomium strumarium]
MAAGEPIRLSLYIYAPNKGAPIFFAIAYFISAVFHIWQCYRYKAWRLIGLHPVCALLFTVGYALREYGAYNYLFSTTTKVPLSIFIVSQIFIYICPPLLELANYHVLGRVFYYVPYCSPLPPNRVLSTFGGLMMLVEVLNSLGVSLAANTSGKASTQKIGSSLTIAAVSIQLLVILMFFSLAAVFHHRCANKAQIRAANVYTLLTTLYLSMALILVRCIYRLAEHTVGPHKIEINNLEALRQLSPLLRYEVFFYVFEASLMLVNSLLWNVWHPGRLVASDNRVYLARDGTEAYRDEDEDKRPLFAKTANMFTFGLLFRRKGSAERFHQLDEYSSVAGGSRGEDGGESGAGPLK